MSYPTLQLSSIPGRGLGAIASRHLAAGEAVISELPILLYPQASAISDVCSFCLRRLDTLGVSPTPCGGCQSALFCDVACAAAAAADPASHCPLVCRSLACCEATGASEDQLTSLHFLLRACSLLLAARPSSGDAAAALRYRQLTELSSRGDGIDAVEIEAAGSATSGYEALHRAVVTAMTMASGAQVNVAELIPAGEVATLLEKDAANGYGILLAKIASVQPNNTSVSSINEQNLAHRRETDVAERRLRGTGIYPLASRVNHECLPNAARFDYFDTSPSESARPGSNTALHLRMLHALPAGEELTQSYFPLTWPFVDRQARCREQFGFECRCPRCVEEATWPAEEGGGGLPGPSGSAADPGYIHVFLLKYVCPRDGCEGTMAPMVGKQDELECAVCGMIRTEAEFLAEFESGGS